VKATWAQGEPEISEKFRGQRDRLMAELAMVDALERGVLSEGDVVIDPVCGPAGGTAKAALKLGLGFVGIEVNASSAEVVRGLL
jgi:tRNA G10  N-methylase Trm11